MAECDDNRYRDSGPATREEYQERVAGARKGLILIVAVALAVYVSCMLIWG